MSSDGVIGLWKNGVDEYFELENIDPSDMSPLCADLYNTFDIEWHMESYR